MKINLEQKINKILTFLHDIEKLKCATRHSWISSGRQESVAEHSWRMAVMAMVLAENFPGINSVKVIEMCLIHDIGEAYDGDIPSFIKNSTDKVNEQISFKKIIKPLSVSLQKKILSLIKEFEECRTQEAKLAKAIDKLEVLIQHNEADISTWIAEEYHLNLTHGSKYTEYSDFIKHFREVVDQSTKDKIENAKNSSK
jgi:putative hydrolases of HD superfamily